MTSDEKFRALVAHEHAWLISVYLMGIGAKHAHRPWGEGLMALACDLTYARARARGRA